MSAQVKFEQKQWIVILFERNQIFIYLVLAAILFWRTEPST